MFGVCAVLLFLTAGFSASAQEVSTESSHFTYDPKLRSCEKLKDDRFIAEVLEGYCLNPLDDFLQLVREAMHSTDKLIEAKQNGNEYKVLKNLSQFFKSKEMREAVLKGERKYGKPFVAKDGSEKICELTFSGSLNDVMGLLHEYRGINQNDILLEDSNSDTYEYWVEEYINLRFQGNGRLSRKDIEKLAKQYIKQVSKLSGRKLSKDTKSEILSAMQKESDLLECFSDLELAKYILSELDQAHFYHSGAVADEIEDRKEPIIHELRPDSVIEDRGSLRNEDDYYYSEDENKE